MQAWIEKIQEIFNKDLEELKNRQSESAGVETDTPCKWKSKQNWSSNTNIL